MERPHRDLDREAEEQPKEHEVLVTVEEGSVGGFGAYVLNLLAEKRLLDRGLKVRTMTLPDVFLDHDKPDRMYAQSGLHAAGITEKVMSVLSVGDAEATRRLVRGAFVGNR